VNPLERSGRLICPLWPFLILNPHVTAHTSFAPATDPTPDPAPTKPKGAGPSPRCPSSCGTGPLPRAVPPSGQNTTAGERRPAYQATVIPAHRVLRRSGSVRSSWSSGAPPPPLCSHRVPDLCLIQYPPTPPASSSPPRPRLHPPAPHRLFHRLLVAVCCSCDAQ